MTARYALRAGPDGTLILVSKPRKRLAFAFGFLLLIGALAAGFDAAADFYTQAAALAANENDPHLLGEIAEAMARLEQRRDRPAQAHELLDNALAQYGAAGDLAAQARVRESLMQLDAGRRPAAEPRN